MCANNSMKQLINNNTGFVALFTLVIMSAALLLLSKNAAQVSLNTLDDGYVSQKGAQALVLADGCAEEVLQRIKINNSYGLSGGPFLYTIDGHTCTIQVTDLGSGNRQLLITGTVDNFHQRLEITLTVGSTIMITRWEIVSS